MVLQNQLSRGVKTAINYFVLKPLKIKVIVGDAFAVLCDENANAFKIIV